MSDKSLTLTQKRIQNGKIFVYVCLALALALDIAVFILLVAHALPAKYWLIALLFAVFDVGFAAVSVVSNFRFGYFKPHLVFYGIGLTVLSLAALFIGLDTGSGTAYTAYSLGIYPAVHAVAIVAVTLTIVFSVNKGVKAKALGFCIAAIMLAVSVIYSVNLISGGYFGQPFGQDTRTLLYSYDEKLDGYAVVGVEDGAGGRVVVPDEFDGKKVCAVNCNIFTASGVTKVELNCAPTVRFDNAARLDRVRDSLVIYASKENLESFRNYFYVNNYLKAARKTVPSGLDDDEVFVTFDFTLDGDATKLYPTWYGKKGETFSLGNDCPEWYKYSDITDDEHLYYAYYEHNKKIFNGLYVGNVNIDKKQLFGSYVNVESRFSEVYQISIGNDNDDAYEMPDSFKCSLVNGISIPYRYVTLSTANALTASAPQRTGFSLGWSDPMFDSLQNYLQVYGNQSTVTIRPFWSLNAPDVSEIAGNSTPVYGEKLQLSVSASHILPGISLRYEWKCFTTTLEATGNSFEIDNVGIDDGGSYYITVTAYSEGNALTSLTSATVVWRTVIVKPRDLHISWLIPEEVDYIAADIPITATYNPEDVINDDVISYVKSYSSVRYVGTYSLYATLTGSAAYKYNAVGTHNVTVKPVPLSIKVHDVQQIYDGTVILGSDCSFTAEGFLGDDTLNYPQYSSIALESPNAGSFPLTVSFPYEKSTLFNYTVVYTPGTATIEKRKVKVSGWKDSVNFMYNGYVQYPTVLTVENGISGDMVRDMFVYDDSTMGIDVGDYVLRATLVSNNYTLGESESVLRSYYITPRPLTLNWGETKLVYNGMPQHPTILTASNVVSRDSGTYMSKIRYSGAQTNVGDGYVVTADIDDKNYTVSVNETCTYSISAKLVTFVWECDGSAPWGNGFSFEYDGKTREPKVIDISGAIEFEKAELLSAKISYSGTNGTSLKNKGYTTITATLDSTNYTVNSYTASVNLQIYAKDIMLAWTSCTFVYDGQPHTATVNSIIGAVDSDVADLLDGITYTGGTITDVGRISVTANLNNENYSAVPLTVVVTVTKRPVTLEWNVGSYEYNGQKQAPTVKSVSNAIGNDSSMILQKITVSEGGVNVGEYTVTATLDDSVQNYKLDDETASCTYTIKKKKLTLTWGGNSFGFTGSPITVAPTNADLPELTATYYKLLSGGGRSLLNGAPTDKGSYIVVFSLKGADANNYELANFERSFTITD